MARATKEAVHRHAVEIARRTADTPHEVWMAAAQRGRAVWLDRAVSAGGVPFLLALKKRGAQPELGGGCGIHSCSGLV